MRHKNSLLPPPVDYLLTLPFWEVHEAAFILTDCWPQYLIASGAFSINASDRFRLGHNVLYTPHGRFNSKEMSSQFRRIFLEIEKAIEKGELMAVSEILLTYCYGQPRTYLIPSHDIIIWTLLKGYILPKNLSTALTVHQIENMKLSKNHNAMVQNQVVIQFIKSKYPAGSKASLYRDDWMVRFGTSKQRKTVRESIDELLGSKKGPGRSSGSTKSAYSIHPLPRIFQRVNGVGHYHFPSLKTLMAVATQIKIDKLGLDRLGGMTEPEFLSEVVKEEAVQIYLKDASKAELHIALQFCYENLIKLYPHPKICAIPIGERQSMKIRKLRDLNKEFCLEIFTIEERKRLNLDI